MRTNDVVKDEWFIVQFTYMDGKDLQVCVESKNLDKLFKDLSNKSFYWNEQRTQAFFTDLDQVRFCKAVLQNDEDLGGSEGYEFYNAKGKGKHITQCKSPHQNAEEGTGTSQDGSE